MSSEVQDASAVISNMLSSNRNVAVEFDCQFDWVWNHPGDLLLRMSLREFPERLTEDEKSSLNMDSTITWAGVSDRIKRENREI